MSRLDRRAPSSRGKKRPSCECFSAILYSSCRLDYRNMKIRVPKFELHPNHRRSHFNILSNLRLFPLLDDVPLKRLICSGLISRVKYLQEIVVETVFSYRISSCCGRAMIYQLFHCTAPPPCFHRVRLIAVNNSFVRDSHQSRACCNEITAVSVFFTK